MAGIGLNPHVALLLRPIGKPIAEIPPPTPFAWNLYCYRSFLIQLLLKFRHLGLEAPVVHDITDFRQKPSDQGRIYF
jgi:hypothetical protein